MLNIHDEKVLLDEYNRCIEYPIGSDNIIEIYYDKKGNFTYKHGYSYYKNVKVIWDEDYDTKILMFIDNLEIKNRKEGLISVYEHEGELELYWEGIPKLSRQYNQYVDGDWWSIRKNSWDKNKYKYQSKYNW